MAIWTHEQKYAFFRLRELVREGRWELRRLPLVGTLELIEESLVDVAISDKKADRVFDEVAEHLSHHPTWQSDLYRRDADTLIKSLRTEPKAPNTRLLLYYFSKRIEHDGVVSIHADVLRRTMQVQPLAYSDVDMLLSSIVLELLYQGHSLAWFSDWLGTQPNWTETFDDFLERMKRSGSVTS